MTPPKKVQKKGLARIVDATRYSLQGLKAAWQNERAFREETTLACFLIPLAIFLPVSLLETLVLICSVLGVLLMEVFNSAIEAVVDRIGPEHHPLSGRAKDLGSAAVFIALVMAGLTWGLILISLLLPQ